MKIVSYIIAALVFVKAVLALLKFGVGTVVRMIVVLFLVLLAAAYLCYRYGLIFQS